jgi:hydrogenase nickel incorporation protein HypA/HybF
VHELSIVQNVVESIGERLGDARVSRVTLEIGRLSGVAADAVRLYFPLVVEGTTLEGADLEIVEPDGRARCRACDTEFELTDLIALCPCGSADFEVRAGDELRVGSVELV